MKKRILGLMTALSLTTALVPMNVAFAAHAADDLPNAPLNVYIWVPNTTDYSSDNYSVEYSTNASEGNYSLRLYNVNEVANRSIFTAVSFTKLITAGETYRISYDHYSEGDDTICPRLNGTDGGFTAYDEEYVHFASGWTNSTVDFTADKDYRSLQFQTWYGDRCIDNVSVCKVNDDGTLGENIAINGNFETIKVRDEHTKYPTGWFGWYNGYDYKLETFHASTDVDAYTGDHSMMVNVYQEVVNKTYSVVTYLDEGLKNGTSYKFEAYIKNIDGQTRASLGNHGGQDAYGWGYIFTGNGTDAGNGWYKLSKTITGDSAQDKTLQMRFWPTGAMLIDNVSLYELDGSGNVIDGAENLVLNGDFEDVLDFESVDPEICYNSNWKIGVHQVNGQNQSTVEKSDYMRFEEVEPGNYALHLNYDDYDKSNTFVKIVTSSTTAIESGVNYTIEYDMKASSHADNAFTIHTLGDWKNGRIAGFNRLYRNVNATDLENGWRHCVTTVDSNSTSTDFTLELGAYCDVIIDNIKVYKTSDASKTNLIPDGDFQETKKRNTEELENVVAYSANAEGKAVVSWTNAFGTIENLKLYVGDAEQEIALNAESTAFNQAVIEGLTPGETYTFKVTATVNGVDKEYTKSLTMKNYRDHYHSGIGNWDSDAWGTYIRDNEAVGYANTNISVVTNEKASGDASAWINSNMPTVLDNVYAGIEQTVELERNKLYKLTFKAKGENVGVFKVIESVTLDEENSFWYQNTKTLTKDWAEYTLLLDPAANANDVKLYDPMEEGTYNARILLCTDNCTGSIWIDDVAVYEVDADDTVTAIGDNVIIDGGFETPELILSDAVFSVNGKEVDKLTAGTMNVSVTAVNEGNLLLIVALYKDGALYSTSVMEKTTSALSENYNTSIDVPALTDGVYTGKVFYWNGSDVLSAHRLPVEIAE